MLDTEAYRLSVLCWLGSSNPTAMSMGNTVTQNVQVEIAIKFIYSIGSKDFCRIRILPENQMSWLHWGMNKWISSSLGIEWWPIWHLLAEICIYSIITQHYPFFFKCTIRTHHYLREKLWFPKWIHKMRFITYPVISVKLHCLNFCYYGV